ncbi:hypothetical protein [Halorussus halophilus]|uniref:hypothetical protein n=1 Tax=Halorussus halophilus TaxID=2650975 RepID=UPI00130157DF|nr:hypothetical protein [Halorussus halophilus]
MSNQDVQKDVAGWVLLVAGIVLLASTSSTGQLSGNFAETVVPLLLGGMLLVGGSVAFVYWQR